MKELIDKIKAIAVDKWLHLLVCWVLACIICKAVAPFCYDAALPPVMAFFVVVLAGIVKELYDYYYKPAGTWSWSDLAFDAVGAVLGVILAIL